MEPTEKHETKPEAGRAKIPVQRLVMPLLPCPFCGAEVSRCPCIIDDPQTECNRIACENCGIEAVWNTEDFEYNVKKWNKRVKPKLVKPLIKPRYDDVFHEGLEWLNGTMKLCPICGNKRCPHATDTQYGCTNSNEPGQVGSSFA